MGRRKDLGLSHCTATYIDDGAAHIALDSMLTSSLAQLRVPNPATTRKVLHLVVCTYEKVPAASQDDQDMRVLTAGDSLAAAGARQTNQRTWRVALSGSHSGCTRCCSEHCWYGALGPVASYGYPRSPSNLPYKFQRAFRSKRANPTPECSAASMYTHRS